MISPLKTLTPCCKNQPVLTSTPLQNKFSSGVQIIDVLLDEYCAYCTVLRVEQPGVFVLVGSSILWHNSPSSYLVPSWRSRGQMTVGTFY